MEALLLARKLGRSNRAMSRQWRLICTTVTDDQERAFVEQYAMVANWQRCASEYAQEHAKPAATAAG